MVPHVSIWRRCHLFTSTTLEVTCSGSARTLDQAYPWTNLHTMAPNVFPWQCHESVNSFSYWKQTSSSIRLTGSAGIDRPWKVPVSLDDWENLNRHHPTIKFTASWSAEEVTFLDTRVYMRGGLVGTDLHVKPTDTHQYLRMDSCHLYHSKTSIPYSQALHLRRICSEEEHLLKWTRELKKTSTETGVLRAATEWWDSSSARNIEGKLFAITTEPGQACSNTAGGHIPSNFTIFSIDHQAPLTNPTDLREATGCIPASPLNSLSTTEES